MTVIFDLQILSNASPFEDDAGVQTKTKKLFSGKTKVKTSTETDFNPTFNCSTEDFTEITRLRAKIGYYGSLVIDSVTYTKCYISSFKHQEFAPGKWVYGIGFTQETV